MEEKLVRQRDEVVERIRRELRVLVRESGSTQRRVEEANGFTQGYLSQVLQGHITLTVRHLYGILLAIGMTPEELFARVLHRTSTDELRERMARYEEALEQLELQGLVKTRKAEPEDE
jgi:transcriptional regulator with XRE-family HTH domain